MTIYPDLVFDTATDPTLIEARIADLAAIYPGPGLRAACTGPRGAAGREVGRPGASPVLADRWRIRVDGGAW